MVHYSGLGIDRVDSLAASSLQMAFAFSQTNTSLRIGLRFAALNARYLDVISSAKLKIPPSAIIIFDEVYKAMPKVLQHFFPSIVAFTISLFCNEVQLGYQ